MSALIFQLGTGGRSQKPHYGGMGFVIEGGLGLSVCLYLVFKPPVIRVLDEVGADEVDVAGIHRVSAGVVA